MIRAFVAPGHPGAYLLFVGGVPVYVGRSDRCVQTRLVGHPYLGRAEHFVWHPCTRPEQAFRMESYWYHQLTDAGHARNLIHPARPTGAARGCPFCRVLDGILIDHSGEGVGDALSPNPRGAA